MEFGARVEDRGRMAENRCQISEDRNALFRAGVTGCAAAARL